MLFIHQVTFAVRETIDSAYKNVLLLHCILSGRVNPLKLYIIALSVHSTSNFKVSPAINQYLPSLSCLNSMNFYKHFEMLIKILSPEFRELDQAYAINKFAEIVCT